MPTQVQWSGPAPKQCDLCRQKITDSFVDGKTLMGPWASMCARCHRTYGRGIGTGQGQKFVRIPSEQGEKWVKAAG